MGFKGSLRGEKKEHIIATLLRVHMITLKDPDVREMSLLIPHTGVRSGPPPLLHVIVYH